MVHTAKGPVFISSRRALHRSRICNDGTGRMVNWLTSTGWQRHFGGAGFPFELVPDKQTQLSCFLVPLCEAVGGGLKERCLHPGRCCTVVSVPPLRKCMGVSCSRCPRISQEDASRGHPPTSSIAPITSINTNMHSSGVVV